MKTKNRTCEGLESYQIEAWEARLGSFPIRRVAHEDRSESYEMDQAHVYELEDGKFALITEAGCSCYEYADAAIDLFPDEKSAMKSFEKWQAENENRN